MASAFITADHITPSLAEAVNRRTIPQITFWNRLEGRPRTENFKRALRAEVRDALWMLARQWQMGEFIGDDAGSPIFAKVRLSRTQVTKYRPDAEAVEPFDDSVPLEAEVERRPVDLIRGGRDISLDLRLMMGRHWLKLMREIPGDFKADFIAQYPIHQPDPTKPEDAIYCAHPEAWSSFKAVAGRRMDGGKLYLYLKANTAHRASDGIAALAGLEVQVDALAARFITWFEKLIAQPGTGSPPGGNAWIPDRLEYQFACSAPADQGEKVLVADEYYHGHLDWYNFDYAREPEPLGDLPEGTPPPTESLPKRETQVLLPTAVTFSGMPHTRWWKFEDGRTNFGDVKPDTTDLAKLLLVEFALIFANDWFLIPYTVKAGSLIRVEGLAVTNVFGERTWVEAAGRGPDDGWQRWAMFLLNIKGRGNEAADTSLFLPPAAPVVIEGRPLEEVYLIRDEIANMVWGIEKTIPLPNGDLKPGREAAFESRAFFEMDLERRLGAPPELPPPAENAKIRYKVMTSVPENWIPMIPVHVENNNREIQLQRAAMPRILEGDPEKPKKVRPRTALMRTGQDEATPQPYFLHEEEVPRVGVRVTQSFQRTRWRDGRAWVWLGARKQTGRGEGSSGLAFDQIVSVKR